MTNRLIDRLTDHRSSDLNGSFSQNSRLLLLKCEDFVPFFAVRDGKLNTFWLFFFNKLLTFYHKTINRWIKKTSSRLIDNPKKGYVAIATGLHISCETIKLHSTLASPDSIYPISLVITPSPVSGRALLLHISHPLCCLLILPLDREI